MFLPNFHIFNGSEISLRRQKSVTNNNKQTNKQTTNKRQTNDKQTNTADDQNTPSGFFQNPWANEKPIKRTSSVPF